MQLNLPPFPPIAHSSALIELEINFHSGPNNKLYQNDNHKPQVKQESWCLAFWKMCTSVRDREAQSEFAAAAQQVSVGTLTHSPR